MNTFTIILSKFFKNVHIVDNEIKIKTNNNTGNTNYNDLFILKQYDNRNISNKNFIDYIHHKYHILNKYVLASFFFC